MHTLHFYNIAWENLPISFFKIDCFGKMNHGNTFFFTILVIYIIILIISFSSLLFCCHFLNILSWTWLTKLILIEKV